MYGDNENSVEIKTMKEDITETKDTVKRVESVVNDMRVLLAGNYITRKEFDKHKTMEDERFEKHEEKERNGRRWWSATIITIVGIGFAILKAIFKF